MFAHAFDFRGRDIERECGVALESDGHGFRLGFVVQFREWLGRGDEHLPEIELPSQKKCSGLHDHFPQRIVHGAAAGEFARCDEIRVREPSAPLRATRELRAPFGSDAGEIMCDIERCATLRISDGERVVCSVRARRGLDDHAALVLSDAGTLHRHGGVRLLLLHFYDRVGWADRFEPVGGGDIMSGINLHAGCEIARRAGIDRTVKGNDGLRFARGPSEHGLRCGLVGVADFENAPLAFRAVAPIRRASVAAHHEIALRRDRAVHRHQPDAREQLRARDVACGRLRELRAPELPARFAGHDRVVAPRLGPESRASRRGTVEAEAAGALVLRAVVEDTRLIHHTRQPARMPRRESVVPPAIGRDVQQFIEGISIRHPCRAFLIGAEKVAVSVELQRHDVAQAGIELLHFSLGRNAHETAAALLR